MKVSYHQFVALVLANDFEPKISDPVLINKYGLGAREGSVVDYVYETEKKVSKKGEVYAIIRSNKPSNQWLHASDMIYD